MLHKWLALLLRPSSTSHGHGCRQHKGQVYPLLSTPGTARVHPRRGWVHYSQLVAGSSSAAAFYAFWRQPIKLCLMSVISCEHCASERICGWSALASRLSPLALPNFSSNSSLKLFSISTFSAIVFILLHGNDVVSQSHRTWLVIMPSNFQSSDITVALLLRTVPSQFSNWTSASTLAFQDQHIRKGTHECIHVEYPHLMSPFSDSMENMVCQHDVSFVVPHHAVLTTDEFHFLTYVEGAEQLDQLTVILIISHYIISSR